MIRTPKIRSNRGFALIATILLMVLLAIITVGTLSLSVVTLRTGTQDSAQARARANARMALMIAIGELQKHTGADTRITASSNIIDPNSPPITGAWRSWEGSNHDTLGRPVQPSYQLKLEDSSSGGHFLSWLISGPQNGTTPAQKLTDLAFSEPQGSGPNLTIPLLSTGTLGDLSTRQVHVYPEQVNESGSFAWWVSGENQKARLPRPYKPDDADSLVEWSDISKSHSVANPKTFGLDVLMTQPELADRAVSLGTVDLIADPNAETKPRSYFLDLSTESLGLLTNAATGGWKKDMSIFTERWNALPTSGLPLFRLTPTTTFTATRPVRPAANVLATNNPAITAATPANSLFYPWSSYLTGPSAPDKHGATSSWHALVDYATSYKTITYDPITDVCSTPAKWARISTGAGSPIPNPSGMKAAETFDYLHTVRKFPVLARIQWLFSVNARRNNPNNAGDQRFVVHLLETPIYTLWNPYNVAIDVNGNYGIAANKPPPPVFAFVNNLIPDPLPNNAFRRLTRGSVYPAGYDSILSKYKFGEFYGQDGQMGAFPVTYSLAPGESKSFSPNSILIAGGGTGQMLNLAEGYNGSIPTGFYRNSNSVTLGNPTAFLNWTHRLRTSLRFDNTTTLGPSPSQVGPGILLNFGLRGAGGYNKYITDSFVNYTTQTNLDFSQAYWNEPADLPKFTVSEIAIQNTNTPAQPTSNPPWTPVFSIIFGPRLTIGAGAGNENDRPTRGLLQNSPFVSTVKTNSDKLSKNHPVNGAYDFSYQGHEPNSDTIPEDTTSAGHIISGFITGNGLSRMILAELPLRPIASIAELQGWDLRAHNPIPPFQYNIIGNSDAAPLIPQDDVIRPDISNDSTNLQHDDAYCANHLLFDDWFFSSIAPEPRDFGSVIARSMDQTYRDFLSGGKDLVNRSYRPIVEDTASSSKIDEVVTDILTTPDGWQRVASRLEVEGMFNVNSTSEIAWRALLSHARDFKVPHHTKNGIKLEEVEDNEFAVSRYSIAPDVKAGSNLGMSGAFANSSQYTGYRTLSEAQIDDFAKKIVEQVRLRGPFLSLSEFVNRQLREDDNLAMAGAIQSALNNLEEDPHEALKVANLSSETMAPGDAKLVGHGYEFPESSVGHNTYGLPGWVRQADVLRPLAPVLSVRDDTFTIRAYGDARDANGKIIAQAWCEAIVQRSRDFVDPTANEADATMPPDISIPQQKINALFGRRYILSGFRWLNKDEV